MNQYMRKGIAAAARGAVLLLGAGTLAAGLAGAAAAQERRVPDTYTAVTMNMMPDGVELRINVLRWSTDEERAAAIAAMGAENPGAALTALPTAGIVWRSGSPVGHAVKFAHRRQSADGGEIVTLVTDRAIGSSSFTPWVAATPADTALAYSVVELTVPAAGSGEGTMSLAAEVRIDGAAATVALDRGGRAAVLGEVAKQPRPYWATGD
jgi:hypothetical protein